MSKGQRKSERQAFVAAQKAAGTYAPRRPVRLDTVRFVARESRITRGRESLLEPSEPADLLTSVRKQSADPHQFAPPDQQTKTRDALGVASIAEATKTL